MCAFVTKVVFTAFYSGIGVLVACVRAVGTPAAAALLDDRRVYHRALLYKKTLRLDVLGHGVEERLVKPAGSNRRAVCSLTRE